jgi:hypothetical protein
MSPELGIANPQFSSNVMLPFPLIDELSHKFGACKVCPGIKNGKSNILLGDDFRGENEHIQICQAGQVFA